MAGKKQESRVEWPEISPFDAGMKCACPRCGEGRLYDGLLNPAKGCMACGLDYSFIDSGDGPAVFVIMILGFVILGLALFLDSILQLPIWLQLAIWTPITIALSIWALRLTKAIMIALQYRTAAREGQRIG
ncbi:MAG: DUF983 domain-containing protein [Rhizobiaceae bacterium]